MSDKAERSSENFSDDLKLGKIRYVGWDVFKDVGLYSGLTLNQYGVASP